jgi:hypothetical protein
MIAMVHQDSRLRQFGWFRFKVVDVQRQHFNQPFIIRNTRFGAMGEKGKAKAVHSEMSFDAVRAFVETKPF